MGKVIICAQTIWPTNLICFPCSSVLEGVKELYLEAAHQNGDVIDPDLQTGLGVPFHLSGEFNRAIGRFNAALTVRPQR